jgi:N4-gp56 family major capsid protein
MARTGASANATRKAWASDIWLESIRDGLLSKLISAGIVVVKTNFTKEKGDNLTYYLRMRQSGDPRVGDEDLIGHAEAMEYEDDSVTINYYKHSVRLAGRMAEQKLNFNLRAEARESQVEYWQWFLENRFIRILCGDYNVTVGSTSSAPTTGRIIYGGDQTLVSGVEADSLEILQVHDIRRAKLAAETASPMIQPLRTANGSARYVMIIHPNQAFTLQSDTEWQNAQIYGMQRGPDNYIHTGALGSVFGVEVWVSDHVPLSYDTVGAAYTASSRTGVLLGKKAGLLAYGPGPWYDEDVTSTESDWGDRVGFRVGRILGMKKAVFNSKDNATVAVCTYAATPVGETRA